MILLILGILVLISSCSYGTYNATGSYQNQTNDNKCSPSNQKG